MVLWYRTATAADIIYVKHIVRKLRWRGHKKGGMNGEGGGEG